jgi:hypothetical protein
MAETKTNGKTHAKEEEAEDVSLKLLKINHFEIIFQSIWHHSLIEINGITFV